MKGYKAYNKGLTCQGFQYKEGEVYEQEQKPSCCNNGFHFCENPLDTLNYYDLCEAEFTEVEALGDIDRNDDTDTKAATNKIKIGLKLDLPTLIKASFDFLWEKCSKKDKSTDNKDSIAASGDSSQLAASGDSSQLAASGDYSKLAASGHSSQLEMSGADSVGANIGIAGIAKGKIGCWITLAEWVWDDKKERYIPACVKSAKIDGKKLKEDTWYKLKDGKFVKTEE